MRRVTAVALVALALAAGGCARASDAVPVPLPVTPIVSTAPTGTAGVLFHAEAGAAAVQTDLRALSMPSDEDFNAAEKLLF